IASLDLLYSADNGTTYSSAAGNLGTGYNMCIDPSLSGSYLLDVNNMVLNPVGSLEVGTMNPFTLASISDSAAFFAYWAGRGVDASAASGWQQLMWQIINGNAPFFYLKNTGTDNILVDGLMYALYGGEPVLTLPGDYPEATYTYHGSIVGSNGCAGLPFDVQMTFNTKPVVSFPGLAAVCLDATAFTLTGASPLNGIYSGTGVSNGMFDPAVAGVGVHTLNYSYTSTNGCSGMASTTIEVFPAVMASAGQDVTLCAGDCADLTATGGVSYTWNTPAQTAMINVCPAQTTTYSVTVTDINGCQDVDDVTVFVNPLPQVSATAVQAICAGVCTPITATGGVTYLWSNESTGSIDTVCPVQTTTYTVTATDVNGCQNQASVTISVNPLPNVDLPSFAGVCVDAAAFSLTTGTPAGGVYSGHGVSNNMFNPAAAGVGVHTIYYSYADNIGCSGIDSATIEVFALPMANAGMDITICEGSCTDLTATGGVSFVWSNGAQTAINNVCPAQQTTFTVTVTDANGCVATDDVMVSLFALPVADAGADQSICAGDCINLLASGGVTYAWSGGQTGAAINVCP
ncbi:MAG: hypothetical protein IH599_06505, partial [Bacteroidales bacterium]|nr:hypothetical protein [Bacteroidales bacterium]